MAELLQMFPFIACVPGVQTIAGEKGRRDFIRKTWLQSPLVTNGRACVRFFLHLHGSDPFVNALVSQEVRP